MEGSLIHHSISVFVVLCSLSLFSFIFFFFFHTNTTVNFKLFLVHHKRGFFFFFLHGCQQQQIPVLKRCSVQVCCHKGFLLFFSSCLFFLTFFSRSHNSNLRFHVNIDAVQNFSTTLLMQFPRCWCCDDRKLKRCGLMPLIPLLFFSSLLFPPQWPNCIYAASRTKKKSERGNFYMLRRFSPRQISKIELLKKQKMMKENIRRFCFIFLCFCH